MAASKTSEPLRIPIGNGSPSKALPLNRIKTTKYTWFSFLPINFYEQFRRAVYFYFLLVTIVSFFVNDTISPMVSLLPLLFVMIVTALKEGLEDYSRSKSDKIVNTSKVTVFRNNQEICIDSEFIMPGDLVLVSPNGDVPCDLVLLHSSGPENKCSITTANLDGETNLKTVFVPPNYVYELENPNGQLAHIVCERSTADLYTFNGRIEVDTPNHSVTVSPLTIENMLLRGVRLNAGSAPVIGCAIYTGMSTKLQLNSRYTGNKCASSENYINKFIIALVIGMVIIVAILYLIQRYKESKIFPTMPYLGMPINYNAIMQIFGDFLSFLILFNYMVPISMYMNIELYRVFGALFMQSDLHLYDEEHDQPCVVNSSNLNEDLGQINVLFSDKTGTLTKNKMRFLKCYVRGKSYDLENNHLYCPNTTEKYHLEMFDQDLLNFFEALCMCHTVQVLKSDIETLPDLASEQASLINKEIVGRYQASSPDEKALLKGCAHLGLIFDSDNTNIGFIRRIVEDSNGTLHVAEQKYERIHVLEFSSERKCMSIIVRDSNGVIWLYAKGAENIIFPLCKKSPLIEEADAEITRFSKEGLRTLAVARRTLTDDECTRFLRLYEEANRQLNNRNELIAKCYASVENDLTLLGATALEDALQDNVSETLSALQEAGLKIWVLTGDKVETSFNIGLSCKHITPDATVHFMVDVIEKTELLRRLAEIRNSSPSQNEKNALVVDGSTVAALLLHVPEEFREVALRCGAVLCCRLSPLQKCEIVTLMKKTKDHITAAIGDGANDVSMIQEAHVGIGIMGREGKQAARCADYAIAKFCMLQRLLLVHGHYNSERLAFLVLFYCYKNIVITGCMALFQIYDLYSATAVYNDIFLWLFDIVYLSVSFTFLAFVEKPYSEDILLSYPQLYKKLTHNKQTSWWIFTKWIMNGALHTLIIFYFAYSMMSINNVVLDKGQTADFACFGTMLIQTVIIVGNLKLLLIAKHMTYINFGFILASIAAFMLSTYIYNIASNNNLYWVYNIFLSSLPLWLFTVICTISCLLTDFVVKAISDITSDKLPGVQRESMKC
ncbi:probable phospholipid-transporting ATPase IF [Scaptodrosophila lebanonensis]|uniref:Phospholipid-transporting ATPase n=1 Tax=Drosophila lebanonensis TaxID=7225 RepID=A0A6J2TUI5_DROLE|nr:probable phospholipid-transporting ATPase IF [Scaptodrosophila lebanonensis]